MSSLIFSQLLQPRSSLHQVVAMMYLKISLSDWWTIFAARTQSFFFTRAPSKIVLAAASAATLASTALAAKWPFPAERYDERADLDAQEPAPRRRVQVSPGVALER